MSLYDIERSNRGAAGPCICCARWTRSCKIAISITNSLCKSHFLMDIHRLRVKQKSDGFEQGGPSGYKLDKIRLNLPSLHAQTSSSFNLFWSAVAGKTPLSRRDCGFGCSSAKAERKHCLPQSKLFIAGLCLFIRGRIQELLMRASSSTSLMPDGGNPGFVQALPERGSGAEFDERKRVNGHLVLWSWIGLLTLTGLFGVAPDLASLWGIWMTDPLRSIGGLILLTSVVLILRVWYRSKWELRGTSWGLLVVALAFVPVLFSRRLLFFWTVGGVRVNFLPSVLPIYLFAGGIILLFAGPRVWLRAWFPLALLLCLQPVPFAMVCFLDLPLQALSAHIARSFARVL